MQQRRRIRDDETDRRWRTWMAAAQRGDRAAYEKLLLELVPHVRRQVSGRIADRAEREDIVQNVFVSLHRARHSYRPGRPFRAWLRAVVRNAEIDWLRARGRRLRHEAPIEATGAAEPRCEARLPEPRALSPELAGALAALPHKQREAVALLQLEDLSVAEAAARVGVSPGALKVRAHRGYRALRALLGARWP